MQNSTQEIVDGLQVAPRETAAAIVDILRDLASLDPRDAHRMILAMWIQFRIFRHLRRIGLEISLTQTFALVDMVMNPEELSFWGFYTMLITAVTIGLQLAAH